MVRTHWRIYKWQTWEVVWNKLESGQNHIIQSLQGDGVLLQVQRDIWRVCPMEWDYQICSFEKTLGSESKNRLVCGCSIKSSHANQILSQNSIVKIVWKPLVYRINLNLLCYLRLSKVSPKHPSGFIYCHLVPGSLSSRHWKVCATYPNTLSTLPSFCLCCFLSHKPHLLVSITNIFHFLPSVVNMRTMAKSMT